MDCWTFWRKKKTFRLRLNYVTFPFSSLAFSIGFACVYESLTSFPLRACSRHLHFRMIRFFFLLTGLLQKLKYQSFFIFTWSDFESLAEQRVGSVGVCWDGDVDDEDALVRYATVFWDGGGLHLEPHESRSIQNLPSEDDAPAGLVSDVKHSARHTGDRFLLEYREGGALLQDARLRERRQPHHVVIGRYAGGKREQLVLQEQRQAACGAVQRAGPEAGPGEASGKEQRCIYYKKN